MKPMRIMFSQCNNAEFTYANANGYQLYTGNWNLKWV